MMNYLRILLLPFSIIYSALMYLRNLFYNINLLKSFKISRPVISVGNITTGGTGKSPFIIFLVKYFISKGLRPAIVSRGYKSKSDGTETVYDGKRITGSTDKCGDEPLMMAYNLSHNFNDFYILSGSNRVNTVNYSIDNYYPDIILLDDAYQHRRIKRDIDIVLIDAEEMTKYIISNSLTLPAGNLRENFGNLKRADIIIQNNKFNNFEIIGKLNKFNKEIFVLKYSVKGFFDINNNEFDLSGKDVCAFAGIAKPSSFFGKLSEYNCNLVEAIAFGDHHNYTGDDISRISLKATKETLFITTEKDFAKIKEFGDFIKYFNVLFMKIELNLSNNNRFFDLIGQLLRLNK